MSEEIKQYLMELIKLQSVSSDPSKREKALETANFIISKLKELGAITKIVPNKIPDKNPLIFGKLGSDPKKKTILFYNHYDVQPALKDDGWDSDPFTLIEKDGYFYGRGTSDDKGPITALYQAIKELQKSDELSVNICWLYEGEEESGSDGFEETVSKDYSFFGKVDGIMVMDTAWYGEKYPSMVYGTRGLVYAFIEISAPPKDLHSGAFGGVFREPMVDLVNILSKLVSLDGKILVEGIYDSVKPVTKEEENLYNNIEFDIEEFKQSIGYKKLHTEDPKTLLMNMWRNPSLTIHGIEGAFYGPGTKTVIPAKVIGKVSIRLVPDQKPTEIAKLLEKFVIKEFEKLHSPNILRFEVPNIGDWWYGDINNFLFKTGKKALQEYWEIEPALVRTGGSVPIIPFMEKTFNAVAIGFSTGQETDGAHSQNERIRIKNLVGAKEVVKMILKEIS